MGTQFRRGGLSILTSQFQRRQLSRSENIITISEYSRNDLVSKCAIPKSKILVSYCGISPEYISKPSNTTKTIDILYVASFEPRKNHIGLLKALAMSPKGLACRLLKRWPEIAV